MLVAKILCSILYLKKWILLVNQDFCFLCELHPQVLPVWTILGFLRKVISITNKVSVGLLCLCLSGEDKLASILFSTRVFVCLILL